MSLILDALKKSELERRGQRALPPRRPPGMDDLLEGPRSIEKPTVNWTLVAGLFLVACAASAVATYKFLQPEPEMNATVGPAPSQTETPAPESEVTQPIEVTDEALADNTLAENGPRNPPAPVEAPDTDQMAAVEPVEDTPSAAPVVESPDPPESVAEIVVSDATPVSHDDVETPTPSESVAEFVESDPPPASSDVVVIYAAEPDDALAPSVAEPTVTDETPADEPVTPAETETAPSEPDALIETTIEPANIDAVASIDPGVFTEREPAPETVEVLSIPLPGRKPEAPPRRSTTVASANESLSSTDPVELYQRASALEQEGLYERAIEAYTAAILARPNFAEAYYGRAWAHIGNKSFAAAIRNFDTLIEINSGMAEAYFGRAWALELTGRYRDAIKDYTAAIDRAPEERALKFNRGILRLYTDDFSGADADFMTIRKTGSRVDQDYALIWTFIARARDGATPEQILPALRDVPAETEWPGRILDFYFGRADREDVLREARKATYPESSKRLTIAYYFLGQFSLMNGDTANAVNDFRRAVSENATGVRQYWASNLELERLGVAY